MRRSIFHRNNIYRSVKLEVLRSRHIKKTEFRSRCCLCVCHKKGTDKLSVCQQSIYCVKNALSRKQWHNYQGINFSASTKLSWQKKPEHINNPEQSAPRGAVWSGLSDCFLHHSRSVGRFHFRSHILKEFFLLKYIWDKQYCILFGNTVDPEQLVSNGAV